MLLIGGDIRSPPVIPKEFAVSASSTPDSAGVSSAGPLSRRAAFAGAVVAAVGAREVLSSSTADAAVQDWSTAGNTVDAGSFVGTKNVQPLIFKTAATANTPLERMRIAPTGQVMVNTTSPQGNLTVNTTVGSVGLRLFDNTTNGTGAGILAGSASAPCLYAINSAGNTIKAVHNGTDGSGAGILVQSTTATGINVTNSTSGTAIYAKTASGTGIVSYGTFDAVYGSATASGGYGGDFYGGSIGAYGSGPVGLYGSGVTTGVQGVTNSGSYGVYGSNGSTGNYGVFGTGGQYAVAGSGGNTAAVRGDNNYVGGWFQGASWGVYSLCTATSGGYGLFGENPNANGYAIFSKGNMAVQGTLSKSAGSFKIDHPLDPTNKWLSHSFVESPDMMNVYNGNVTLGADGTATVTLPNYFNALNKEYRYQLTCVGGYANVYIAAEVSGNTFKIAGGKSGLKVSWQVTGIRQDDYAKAHPIVVEQAKTGEEKGTRSFVPKGSGAKAMAFAPTAPAVKAEAPPKVEQNRAAPAKPKPAVGQNWTPSKL